VETSLRIKSTESLHNTNWISTKLVFFSYLLIFLASFKGKKASILGYLECNKRLLSEQYPHTLRYRGIVGIVHLTVCVVPLRILWKVLFSYRRQLWLNLDDICFPFPSFLFSSESRAKLQYCVSGDTILSPNQG
jgi:hypothetical protein